MRMVYFSYRLYPIVQPVACRVLYASAMRQISSGALVHAPSSPVRRIHLLVRRRTRRRLGDAPIVHTAAPPALPAGHPVLPRCVRLAGRATPFLGHHTAVGPPARCAPTPHQYPCRSPNQSDVAPGTGLYCSAAQCPSHPRALHATPLVSAIAPRYGECRAVLALPFWRWRRTSLPRHGKEVPPADANRESSRSFAPLGAAAFGSASG
ncbi:hypothetical protein B0H14DRAFT_1459293 [Mycena olivaceomarginata]|nr:hypothetical protein B0H14DRAFT_1459293 [Mycena olivaceomarginata]